MSKYLERTILIIAIMAIVSSGALAGTATVRILDDCQGKFLTEIGSYEAETGNTFLVVGMEIEFKGSSSDSFFVDSSVFDVAVGGNKYPYSLATFSLDSLDLTPLKTMTLSNGGKTTGYMAFEVPEETNEFKIEYVGKEDNTVIPPACEE